MEGINVLVPSFQKKYECIMCGCKIGNSLLDMPESVSSPTEKHHKVTVHTPAIVLNTDDGVEKILRTETRNSKQTRLKLKTKQN